MSNSLIPRAGRKANTITSEVCTGRIYAKQRVDVNREPCKDRQWKKGEQPAASSAGDVNCDLHFWRNLRGLKHVVHDRRVGPRLLNEQPDHLITREIRLYNVPFFCRGDPISVDVDCCCGGGIYRLRTRNNHFCKDTGDSGRCDFVYLDAINVVEEKT